MKPDLFYMDFGGLNAGVCQCIKIFIKLKINRINDTLQYFIRNASFYLTPKANHINNTIISICKANLIFGTDFKF